MKMLSDDKIKANISQNLKRLLKVRRLTQSELAVMTKLSESVISDIATGKSIPGLSNAMKIAEAFDVTVDRLASDPPKEKSSQDD